MSNTFTPGPTPNTVRTADGKVVTVPEDWVLVHDHQIGQPAIEHDRVGLNSMEKTIALARVQPALAASELVFVPSHRWISFGEP